jgi:hypothetical protein
MTRFMDAAGALPASVKPEVEIMSKLANLVNLAKMQVAC